MTIDPTQEPATVVAAEADRRDEYGAFIHVSCRCSDGRHTPYAVYLRSPEDFDLLEKNLLEAFGVVTLDKIVGEEVLLLRSWPDRKMSLVGIVSRRTRRRVVTHDIFGGATPLKVERAIITEEIERTQRELARLIDRNAWLGETYVEWGRER